MLERQNSARRASLSRSTYFGTCKSLEHFDTPQSDEEADQTEKERPFGFPINTCVPMIQQFGESFSRNHLISIFRWREKLHSAACLSYRAVRLLSVRRKQFKKETENRLKNHDQSRSAQIFCWFKSSKEPTDSTSFSISFLERTSCFRFSLLRMQTPIKPSSTESIAKCISKF